jgi:hypothetical protein
MGGAGSGRHGGQPTTDECRSLDINRLHREGWLRPGWTGTLHWSRDGETVASISMCASQGRVILSYRYRYDDDEWQAVEEPVLITWTPCHFGGSRPWFVCPGGVNGVHCGRRVGRLHGPGRYFLCRLCYGLAYQSQREQPHERALRRASRIRMRLGGEPGMLCPFPEKPKGMHWRTFERLRQRVRDAEMVAEDRLWVQLGRIKARPEWQKRKLDSAKARFAGRPSSKGFWK